MPPNHQRQYPSYKPTIEYFACGHARDYISEADITTQHTQTHHAFTFLPSQAWHIFTNRSCRQHACLSNNMGNCSQIDSTVPIEPFTGTEHLKLQRRYAQYRSDLAQIGVDLANIHSDYLEPFCGIRVPWISRLFDLFPNRLRAVATLNEDAMRTENWDVQTLISRVFQQQSGRTPPYSIQIMCHLGNMALNVLEDELRSLAGCVGKLRKFATDMESNLTVELHHTLGNDKVIDHLRAWRHNQAQEAFAADLLRGGPHDWNQVCWQGAFNHIKPAKPAVPVAHALPSLKRKRGELPQLTIVQPPDLFTLGDNPDQNDDLRVRHLRTWKWPASQGGLRSRDSTPLSPLGGTSPRSTCFEPQALVNSPFSPRTVMARRTAAAAEVYTRDQLRADVYDEKWEYGFKWDPAHQHLIAFYASIAPDYGWWIRR